MEYMPSDYETVLTVNDQDILEGFIRWCTTDEARWDWLCGVVGEDNLKNVVTTVEETVVRWSCHIPIAYFDTQALAIKKPSPEAVVEVSPTKPGVEVGGVKTPFNNLYNLPEKYLKDLE